MSTTVLSIRLNDEVLARLKDAAEKDDRKVATMASLLVERGLKAESAGKKR